MNALRQLEQTVLAKGREWTRRRLEERLQAEAAGVEPLCPKTGQRLQDTRWRDLHLNTVVGAVQLRGRHGSSPVLGHWVCPARQAWGLET